LIKKEEDAMQKHVILILTAVFCLIAAPAAVFASSPASRCSDADTVCGNLEQLFETQQPEKIVEQYSPSKQFSEASLRYIGAAYMALASQRNILPDQEEGYYRKALEVKYNISYMGLYFFYVQKDKEKALGFLREYVKTRPIDTLPFIILGEVEMNRNNVQLADSYLRSGREVAYGRSPRIDWLLFQTNFLLKNYEFSRDMFVNAVTKGNFNNELRSITSDPRFAGIDKRPEFIQFHNMLKVAQIK
jgi:hypothetical protein